MFSTGLDSTLAAFLLADQGIDFVPFSVRIPFRTPPSTERLAAVTSVLGKQVFTFTADQEYLRIVLHPKHGYGSGMNPCMDCKVYFLSRAREHLDRLGAAYVVTGDVLDQRDMSQHLRQMQIIERESGLEGLIVRPLTAKNLPPSIPEQRGWIDRSLLLGIRGKVRKDQIRLAQKYGIADVSSAGGCLLTDQMYILRFRELLAHVPNPAVQDVELLRIGRHHYRGNDRIILGRNEQENAVLAEHADPQQHLLIVPDFPGPSALCIPAPDSTTTRAELADTAMSLIRERSRKRHTPVSSAPIPAGGDS